MSVITRTVLCALALAGCGGNGGSADGCEGESCPCEGDACSTSSSAGDGGSSETLGPGTSGGAATSGDDAVTDDGASTTGSSAPFSVLPPFDVLGAEWVWEHVEVSDGDVHTQRCTIADRYDWPDGQPGATTDCTFDGDPVSDQRYALYPDRIDRRELGDNTFDPPAEIFRVPVEVGDAWELQYNLQGTATERWTAIAAEPVELAMGTFDAIVIELVVTRDGTDYPSTLWWVDGIGRVKVSDDTYESELLSFSVP